MIYFSYFDLCRKQGNGIPWALLGSRRGVKQLVNYFRSCKSITNKHNTVNSLKAYCSGNGLDVAKFIPLSFVIPRKRTIPAKFAKFSKVETVDSTSEERDKFLAAYKADSRKQRIWIAKPSSGGKGIGIK